MIGFALRLFGRLATRLVAIAIVGGLVVAFSSISFDTLTLRPPQPSPPAAVRPDASPDPTGERALVCRISADGTTGVCQLPVFISPDGTLACTSLGVNPDRSVCWAIDGRSRP